MTNISKTSARLLRIERAQKNLNRSSLPGMMRRQEEKVIINLRTMTDEAYQASLTQLVSDVNRDLAIAERVMAARRAR